MDRYLIKTAYSWGDEEPDIAHGSFEEAWEDARRMAFDEAETVSEEHGCEIGLSFSKEDGKIALHYTYDDEYCVFSVAKEYGGVCGKRYECDKRIPVKV